MSQATNARRTQLVDPEVQGGVVKKIAQHWGIFFVCNAVALMIWIRLFEQPDVRWSETFVSTVQRFLPFFVITLALIPAFILDTLKLTNRFAGPISRLRSAISDASHGLKVEPLDFRENDYWHNIAVEFNRLVERNTTTPAGETTDSSNSDEAYQDNESEQDAEAVC